MSDKKYAILTFGCQMNMRDSHWLASSLESHGFKRAEESQADVIIINTCSVREKPEKKLTTAIRRVMASQGKNSRPLICVTGCVAQQMGERLLELSENLRLVAGTDKIGGMAVHIDELLREPDKKIVLTTFSKTFDERPEVGEKYEQGSAFVSIMQGCDNFCSYCIVPFTRGVQRSRRKASILAECANFLEHGALEITLLGQNVNAWGKDTREDSFISLLRDVAALPGLQRLKFVTPHPRDMDPETVRAFAEMPNMCPRLHLPVQAGSDHVLERMRRRYTKADYLKLVRQLREARPDIALATDIIVGFPGESESDFQQTLELMEECDFVSSFSFCYSDRPGTRASLMPDKIDREIQLDRLGRLQAFQDCLTRKHLLRRQGQICEILLESPSARENVGQSCWQGRDPYGLVVNVPLSEGKAGMLTRVRITDVKKHSLVGELI